MRISQDSDFNFFVPIDFEKSKNKKTGKKVMKIKGIASTPDKDSDGETLLPIGFDLSRFLKIGYLNYNHGAKTDASKVIGEPTLAKITPKGELYVEGILYSGHPLAESVWNLAETLERNGSKRRIGFSIEGKATKRDSMNPKIITEALLTGLAITPVPVNTQTYLDICKGEQKEDFLELDNEEDFLIKSEENDILYEFKIGEHEFSINKSFEVNEIEKSIVPDIEKENPSQAKIKEVMGRFKAGILKDSHGKVVTDRDQAVAIAMSEASIEKTMDSAAFQPVTKQSIDPDVKVLDIASKAIIKKAIELDIIKVEDLIEKSREKLEGGNWVTIDGNHVYMKGGKVVAGQPKVMGDESERENNIKGESTAHPSQTKDKVYDLKSTEGIVQAIKDSPNKGIEGIYKLKSQKIAKELLEKVKTDKDFKAKLNTVSDNKAEQEIYSRLYYLQRKGIGGQEMQANIKESRNKGENFKPNKKEGNKESKNFNEASKFKRESLNPESSKSIESLQKYAAKLDDKYLSKETKEKIKNLVDDLIFDDEVYDPDNKFTDDILNVKGNLSDFLKVAKKVNDYQNKHESYALESDAVNKLQDVIVGAALEQSKKKTTEILNYKLF